MDSEILMNSEIVMDFNSTVMGQPITERVRVKVKITHDPTMSEESEQFTGSDSSPVPNMPSSPVPNMSDFVVGLDNRVSDVKQILFEKGVSIVGVKGRAGSGKTTLALALYNDPQVKDFFQNNIVFIPVPLSPNVMALLESMWDEIIGGPRPVFQSIQDARNQLQKELSLKGNPQTLVILDDVWSKSDVDQLLFEAEGYKTVITTRRDSAIPHTDSSRVYGMRKLQEDDALSLFCFCAFGQPSIPTSIDEVVVKQAEAVCMGLPRALKVIGSYLRGKPQHAWETVTMLVKCFNICRLTQSRHKMIVSSSRREPQRVWENAKKKLSTGIYS